MAKKNTSNTEVLSPTEILLAKKLEAKLALESRIEELKVQREINYLDSEQYLRDGISETDMDTVLAVSSALDGISDIKFNRYKEFNFGALSNELIANIKTCMLQKKDGFTALDEAIVMSEPLSAFVTIVESSCREFPDHLGRNTYFDKLSGQIVQGEVGDANQMVAILETVARKMDLIDPKFGRITQEKLRNIESKSKLKADTQYHDNLLLDPLNTGEVKDVTFKVG